MHYDIMSSPRDLGVSHQLATYCAAARPATGKAGKTRNVGPHLSRPGALTSSSRPSVGSANSAASDTLPFLLCNGREKGGRWLSRFCQGVAPFPSAARLPIASDGYRRPPVERLPSRFPRGRAPENRSEPRSPRPETRRRACQGRALARRDHTPSSGAKNSRSRPFSPPLRDRAGGPFPRPPAASPYRPPRPAATTPTRTQPFHLAAEALHRAREPRSIDLYPPAPSGA